MSTEDQFRVEVGPLHFERGTSPSPYDRLLGNCKDPSESSFADENGFGRTRFRSLSSPAAVAGWLRRGGELEFETVEADASPFLAVRPTGGACRIEAAWQKFAIDEPLSLDAVRETFARLAKTLALSAQEQLQIEVDDLLNRQAG